MRLLSCLLLALLATDHARGQSPQTQLAGHRAVYTHPDNEKTRYRARIVLDESMSWRQQLSGYFNMTVVDYDVADKNRDRFPTALNELARYMRDHTGIDTDIKGTTVRLSSPDILKAPFLYLTGDRAILQPSVSARQNLGQYLRHGGFLFAEDIRHSNTSTGLENTQAGVRGTPFDMQFKALISSPEVLGSLGTEWVLVPKEHPLYHSYWSFPDGPPLGGAPLGNVFDLEMLEVRGRVAVVFSDLNISWYWGDPLADARERGLQFGVNLVVFALTQPGGIASFGLYTP
jgi:hypothetical protein